MLSESLGKLKNVNRFTIRALPDRQSFLYREFLDQFLDILGPAYPSLRHLGLEGNFHHQSLSFLSSLQELRSLSFDGFSASLPTETATLSGLPHLTNVSLVSQHSVLTPTIYIHSSFTKRQSFTADVLLAINPLTSFSITKRNHSEELAGLHFTPKYYPLYTLRTAA
ncbi:hypothetical protein K469DRAFT_370467 [Zopfia rhizophila CBS 207.26]|uniref:Uncharacterized protein n=1 Tax=Zopfia rhizophila CBS 207.26 TaxID=1314779 RepID=A0A6A6EJT3_9PEZI|nr:hypothetical protein K469DRAFT_370467 [Zopfia rhizophila CBS 207.26]